MPVILVGFVAVGVALLALLIAYALTVIFTPILEGLARSVPVVGGYLARGVGGALDWAGREISKWANEGVHLVAGWLHGLSDVWDDFLAAVQAFAVELADSLDTFVTKTVPHLIQSAIADVRAEARAAAHEIAALVPRVGALERTLERELHGIEGTVRGELDRALDVIRNVDLPQLEHLLEREISASAGQVEGKLHDATTFADHEFARLWDALGKIPLQQLLELLATTAGAGALVNIIAREAGLDTAECRAKVRGICSTDPAAWQALLDIAGLALVWVGIEEFVRLAQDFARETLPPILEHVHGG